MRRQRPVPMGAPQVHRAPSRILALLGALLLVFALAPGAAAKEGSIVKLAAPLPRDAEPGTTITVHFSVEVLTDTGSEPLIGSPVFVRLIGRTESTEAGGREEKPGSYVAQVVVPAGGIVDAQFGLRGTAYYPDGRTERSDMLFAFQGVLLSGVMPPAGVGAAPPAANPGAGDATSAGNGTGGADPGTTPVATPAPTSAGPDWAMPLLAALLAAAALAVVVFASRRSATSRA